MAELSERALAALLYMAEHTDARDPEPRYDTSPRADNGAWAAWHEARGRMAYAFQVEDALRRAGLTVKPSRRGAANGAANTLVALRRRGLVANDGGGVFLQAKWWVTTAGAAEAERLRAAAA